MINKRAFDNLRYKTRWILAKFVNDLDFQNNQPYEKKVIDGNILVNAGINLVWALICGGAGTAFNNANAYIGVGDSNVAEAATQTDLQAAVNKLRKAMDATYPTYGTSQKASWRSTFGGTDANWAWKEFAVFNAAAAGTMLNRKVSDQGTKTAGQTWQVTLEITLS